MVSLRGLSTGIGSLPHKDVEQSLDLVFRYTRQIPFWPQLPKRDKNEAMVAQASEGFPFLKIKDKQVILDADAKDAKLESFYQRLIDKDSDYFKISEDFAAGLWGFYRRLESMSLERIRFIKCQICGPFTFAASINDTDGKAILHDEILMQAVLNGLAAKARWQIQLFKKFNKPLIVFVDEPYLGGFGSAYTPINREEVVGGLTELLQGIKEEGALTGVHCCGNTDWSIFTDIPPLDIISFDAYSFLERLLLYADNLSAFFKRGGFLCWGIVPTTEFTGRQNADLLVAQLEQGIAALAKKKLDAQAVRENLMLSPSCGMGALEPATAENILSILSEISDKIK